MRLLNTALNADADAQIYIRNSIFDNLMNFYTSPLAENEAKRLIIQVFSCYASFCKGIILIFLFVFSYLFPYKCSLLDIYLLLFPPPSTLKLCLDLLQNIYSRVSSDDCFQFVI